MPRFQPKVVGFVALLLILTIYYITNGARSTYESEFYQRTVSVLEKTKDATSRQIVAEDERQRAERVERLRIEHDAATAAAATPPEGKDDTRVKAAPKQQPLQDRKKSGGKVVDDKLSTDSDDGVAKVGNVRGGNSLSEKEESESNEEHDVEVYLNEILKKGPIIVFSKSYCPYSKKAKVCCFPSLAYMSIARADRSRTAYPPGPLHHNSTTIRRGTRP